MTKRSELTKLAMTALLMASAAPVSGSASTTDVLLAAHSCGSNGCRAAGQPVPNSNRDVHGCAVQDDPNRRQRPAENSCAGRAGRQPDQNIAQSGCMGRASGRAAGDDMGDDTTYPGTSIPQGKNDGYPSTPRKQPPQNSPR